MKLLIASDVHGGYTSAEKIAELFKREKADKLVLCGDLLYHGPRNDLPQDYNPKKVIAILNKISGDIIAVRGNCEAEVDQMVLEFPCMCDYALIYDGKIRIYITHGHLFDGGTKLNLKKNDVMVSGHTHVLKAEERDGVFYLNPGSCTIPKENNPKTYMIYENDTFYIKDFENNIIKTLKIGEDR